MARQLGVAPRRLWGWEPRELHEHEYDAEGRLVRTVVEREAEFDAEQWGMLGALAEYEAGLNEYGVPLAEATSKDADANNPKGKYRYVAHSFVDHAALAVLQAQREKDAEYKAAGAEDPFAGARKVRVERVDR